MFAILVASICLQAIVAAEPASPKIAIFRERDFPYYMANHAVRPQDIAEWLHEAGLEADLLGAAELADPDRFNARRYWLLIHPYGNTFPLMAVENIRRFHAAGGCIASPGVPFCHPCVAEGARDWAFSMSGAGRAESEGAKAGRRCIHISKRVPRDWIGITTKRLPTRPGTTYTVAGWVRTSGNAGRGDDHLFVRFWAGGTFVGQDGPTAPRSDKWTFIAKKVTVPEGVDEIDVSFQVFSPPPADVWLDEVVLVEGELEGAPQSADQVAGNLISNAGFEIPGPPWRDLGHDSTWFDHQHIGTGGFWNPPKDEAERGKLQYFAASDPCGFRLARLLDPSAWMQTVEPNSLPREDRVIPVVGYLRDGQPVPVWAFIVHRCPQFRGAIDCRFGVLFTGYSYRDFQAQHRMWLRATAWMMREKGLIDRSEYARLQRLADAIKIPRAIAGLRPRYARRPFRGVLPRALQPERKLAVVDVSRLRFEEKLAALCLQGLVNRQRPRVYVVGFQGTDQMWLDWLKEGGYIDEAERIDFQQLWRRFGSIARGAIIPDPAVPGTINVATTLAGIHSAIVATPELARRLDLPILVDLRGRFKRNVDAYRWLVANYWPRINHNVIAILWPRYLPPRDYLVAFNVLTFWISGPKDGQDDAAAPIEELRFAEEVLARLPVNIPCLGYPWAGKDVGIGEGPGVKLLAEFAKYLVGSIGVTNLTVHSGFQPPTFRQHHPPAPELDRSKVYLAFVISDGDNLPVLTNAHIAQTYPGPQWNSPARGKVPLGWSISPAGYWVIPTILDWYYKHAAPTDCFLGAVSGIGYTYPDFYATRYRGRMRIFDGFLAQTAEAMKLLDLDCIWIMNATKPELIQRYADKMPFLRGIFPDYSRRGGMTYERAVYRARQAAVFHALTRWNPSFGRDQHVQMMVDELRQFTPPTRPAFLHAFVINWFFCPDMLAEVAQRLGPEYVPVRPDHLAELYLEAAKD